MVKLITIAVLAGLVACVDEPPTVPNLIPCGELGCWVLKCDDDACLCYQSQDDVPVVCDGEDDQ